MGMILFCLTLVALAGGYSLCLRWRFDRTLSLACFTVILLLYISGLFGDLRPGAWSCLALAGIAAIYGGCKAFRDRGAWLREFLLTPGFAFCLLFFLFTLWAHSTRLLTGWDDLSHWGLVVKNMFMADRFATAPGTASLFRDYPPAAGLLQYLFCWLDGQRQEAYLFRACNIFTMALALPFFNGVVWRSNQLFLPVAVIAFVLPATFFGVHAYLTIYQDCLLGLLYGYSFLFFYMDGEAAWKRALAVSLSLAVLTLVKNAGAGMAVIASAVFALEAARAAFPAGGRSLLSRLAPMSLPLSCLSGAVFARLSWSAHLRGADAYGGFWTSAGSMRIMDALRYLLQRQGHDVNPEVAASFLGALGRRAITGHPFPMSCCAWLAAITVLGFYPWYGKRLSARRKDGRTGVFMLPGLVCGAFAYLFVLLLSYLYVFPPFESSALASFERYAATYLLGAVYALMGLALSEWMSRADGAEPGGESFWKPYGVWLLALVLPFFADPKALADITVNAGRGQAATWRARAPYSHFEQAAATLDPSVDRCYFINQNGAGSAYVAAMYVAAPVRLMMRENSWSFGKPYHGEDRATRAVSRKQWEEILRDGRYTHVYLFHVDTQFRNLFQGMFDRPDGIRDQRLFRIYESGDSLRLAEAP